MRLPRDWLGPREELVPFGPQAASLEPEEPPRSPADFWGEQSAELQSALQGPAASEDRDGGPVGPQATGDGHAHRRAVAGVAAIVAIATATVVALVSSSLGPGRAPAPAGGSNVGFAAVLSGGVASVLRLDLGRVEAPRAAGTKAALTPHLESATARIRKPPRPRLHLSVRDRTSTTVASPSSYHATTTEASDATSAGSTDTHSDTPPASRSGQPRTASQPVASRAAVSATGESGALGPIQSPNG